MANRTAKTTKRTIKPTAANTDNMIMHADAVIGAIIDLGIDQAVAQAMPKTWQFGVVLMDTDNTADQVHAYRLLLRAVAGTPGAAQALVDGLLAALQPDTTITA